MGLLFLAGSTGGGNHVLDSARAFSNGVQADVASSSAVWALIWWVLHSFSGFQSPAKTPAVSMGGFHRTSFPAPSVVVVVVDCCSSHSVFSVEAVLGSLELPTTVVPVAWSVVGCNGVATVVVAAVDTAVAVAAAVVVVHNDNPLR